MAKPDVGTFAQALYDQVEPLTYAEEALDFPLLKYLGGIGEILESCNIIARDWSILLDIDRIPDEGVPWLGQFIGVNVNPSFSVEQQKQQIRDHESWQRGTPATLMTVVKRFLSGTKSVQLLERDTDAYHFTVVTYAEETPSDFTYADLLASNTTYQDVFGKYPTYQDIWSSDQRQTMLDAIASAKPAGLQYDLTILPGAPGTSTAIVIYATILVNHPTYADIYNRYQTYDDLYSGG